jgi:23S rRNA (uracil1939-C5)-methyltransferase
MLSSKPASQPISPPIALPNPAANPCPHLGTCGGCAASEPPDKIHRLRDALSRAGYPDAPLQPLLQIPFGTRRRVDLALQRHDGAIRLGFHQRRARDVVDIRSCPADLPSIAALITPLRTLVPQLTALRKTGSILINQLDNGLDLTITLDAPATPADRARLIAFARTHALLRISLGDEPILVQHNPTLTVGPLTITPPPGAFLQPTLEGEAAIRTAILAGLPRTLTRKSRFIELYAGIGTLTGTLLPHARIHAVEGNKAACAALEAAARAAQQSSRLTIEPRDLARRPLTPKEFFSAAALILDPPFDGTGPQRPAIAASGVKRIIHISCNPDALTLEANSLRRAGYSLATVTPIDQFPGTEHLESVSIFSLR